MYHHKWSITEFENLIPWERDIMIAMIHSQIQEEINKNG